MSPRTHPGAASSSDPTVGRRKIDMVEIPDSESGSTSEDDNDDSDNLGNGVSVEPERNITVVPARKPVGGGRKKGRR